MKAVFERGFTTLELVITLVIIGVLAAIAVPSYLSYLRSAEISKTVAAGDRLKVIVEHCIKDNKSVHGCNSGSFHVPASLKAGPGKIGRHVVDGQITVTAPSNARYGVDGATYILVPVRAGEAIKWHVAGSACDKKYIDC